MNAPAPALILDAVSKEFAQRRSLFGRPAAPVRAVDTVSFVVNPGETLGLVGESGCGKSTLARMILRMTRPTTGHVLVEGKRVDALLPSEVLAYRRQIQMIFQDPYASLNPRIRAGDLIGEPMAIHGLARGAELETRVADLAAQVGLSAAMLGRYPHEFSGGQRQRIAIARALAVSPRIIVADEPVSALDVSVRAQVLNLMADLQTSRGLSYVFISHDIGTVAYLSHRVAVMYLGAIVEIGPARDVLRRPRHPYTRLLLEAVPVAHPRLRVRRREVLPGEVPNGVGLGAGCRFAPRCPMAQERCRVEAPTPRAIDGTRLVACHFAEDTPDLPKGLAA
ncbi:ATP-binding cassette domain-containing protein [Mesorhizobium sp. BR1-1-16]|uniref:ABC transporter ATP-binding protein n=1 Tax=Mesorhizobium sp. BR1-1-16 TaxID=2876653 RepID=UPI001CD0209A|nr:oligopeptide/dipeptide ABC transporter ATP-binding protein [Mesorhizobium sp. BR1-1-16]MBZ9939279.1 ATP-binding cassette domain-containing protein [Mesorhizobium sp. BR1-1-16]